MAVSRGPSPLARGNLAHLTSTATRSGAIPARAGQPGNSTCTNHCLRGHPRSRGATADWRQSKPHAQGPSPLARGNRPRQRQRTRAAGAIPARAGQPRTRRNCAKRSRGHPRSRGATPNATWVATLPMGPSPLARGNRPAPFRQGFPSGAIPARAGQPHRSYEVIALARGHPRSRGATGMRSLDFDRDQGPSPLARGNLYVVGHALEHLGAIPARAGQPTLRSMQAVRAWGHPRSRGATHGAVVSGSARTGPSPLARGNQHDARGSADVPGAIPARAGQPAAWPLPARPSWGHPRSRGATPTQTWATTTSRGPSPLARGNRRLER